MSKLTNILLTLLALAMLCGAALAVPAGDVTDEAHNAYLDMAPVDEDDEYAFLFADE